MSDENKKPGDAIRRLMDPLGLEASPTWKLIDRIDGLTKMGLPPLTAVEQFSKMFSESHLSAMERFSKTFEESHLATTKRLADQVAALFPEPRFLESMRAFNEAPFLKAARSVQEELKRHAKVFETFTSAAEAAAKLLPQQIAAMDEATKSMSRALATSVIAEQATAYTKILEQMRPAIDPEFFASLDRQFAGMVVPTASALSAGDEDRAVLTRLDGVPDVLGAVSWVQPEIDQPVIRSAGLRSREYGRGPNLHIEVAIRCALCGDLMIAPQRGVEWDSDSKARVEVKVLPMCPKCVHEVQGSPEYWIEKLAEVRSPKLKLISGDGEDPEHSGHEHLRLVETPDDSDDPGDGNEIP